MQRKIYIYKLTKPGSQILTNSNAEESLGSEGGEPILIQSGYVNNYTRYPRTYPHSPYLRLNQAFWELEPKGHDTTPIACKL